MIDQAAIERLLRRNAQMRSDRQVHEHIWRKCFDYSFPERGEGLGGSAETTAAEVAQKLAAMTDATGRNALGTWIAGVIGGVTPSNQQWADLDAGRESDVEKLWLSEAARTIWENIHNSNYDAEIMDCMSDLGPAGWFVLYIDEADEGGYAFECWPMGECYYSQSRKAGNVDIIHRCYRSTVEQLVTDFGIQHVSPKVRDAFNNGKFDDKVEVMRVIEPRRASNGVLARTMPFQSITIEVTEKHLLREGGYHEFPCVVPRWRRLPNSVYATGPFLDAYADVKSLNTLSANELASTDLAVAGMWIGKADGILNPANIRVGPRKVIAAADTDNLKPLMTGADFQVGWTVKEALQAQVRHTLMADQLEPQDKPQMTAFEVHTRVQMIRQRLGPAFGRFQAEFTAPLIERCFGIALRAGVLGEPPASLRGRAYSVRYTSPLARAQKAEDVTAIESSLMTTGNLYAARQDESVWDVVDLDEAQRQIYEGRGVPAKLIRSKDDIQALRDQRAEATKQEREQIQGQEAAANMMKQGV